MAFKVTILGSNSAIPANDRHPTSQVLQVQNRLFLIDCGEGTQIQLSRYNIKRGRIDNIFISHLHGDHFFGLIGLITSYHLLRKPGPLHIHGPAGLRDIIETQLKYSGTQLIYELVFHDTDDKAGEIIFENSSITVTALEMVHRIRCNGFLFKEKPRERNMIPEKIAEHNIPVNLIENIKKGAGFTTPDGRTIPNHELTKDPAPPRTYAFLTDTAYNERIIPYIKGADLLYHESTFGEESAARAVETYHCTARQAAEIAKKAGVKKLVLGHFSAKYKDLSPLLNEATEVFPNTELAVEGASFEI